ncbi:hypothetical protein AMD24_00393 [Candidatus Xiphinematobacter sp. Idaho Grape]|nr:hypothetical protein AMD24_00393 [Candidatus Xiphinematobacter sp. Idaho Grape]
MSRLALPSTKSGVKLFHDGFEMCGLPPVSMFLHTPVDAEGHSNPTHLDGISPDLLMVFVIPPNTVLLPLLRQDRSSLRCVIDREGFELLSPK